MTQLLSNVIQCKLCKETIESKHQHEFVACSCGSCAVDGGITYLRRIGNLSNYIDLSITTDDPFEKQREAFKWGTYGKYGDQPYKKVPLNELTTNHILAILSTQQHIKGSFVEELLNKELEFRGVKNESI